MNKFEKTALEFLVLGLIVSASLIGWHFARRWLGGV